MTLVDHSMKDMNDVSFKEFSVENKDVYIYTPDRWGYNGLNFMFLTSLSDPNDKDSKVTYTAVEYLVSVPEGDVKKEFVDKYLSGGADAMLTLLQEKLRAEDFAGTHKYYTSVQAFVNESQLWNRATGLQFRIIANIHDVENLGSVSDFYAKFIDPVGTIFGLTVAK